jgi:hypothetical protein
VGPPRTRRPAERRRRKVTTTIDDDLARELERRQRAERLAALLDELDHSDGPLAADAAEDARLARLLGGAA